MSAPIPYHFLLLPGFDLMALGQAAAALSEAGVDFRTIGLTRAPVFSSTGIRVDHAGGVEGVGAGEVLMVLAGLELDADVQAGARGVIARAASSGARLWAIGGAVVLLAPEAPFMGRPVAVNPKTALALRARDDMANTSDVPFLWEEDVASARDAGLVDLIRYDLKLRELRGEDAWLGETLPEAGHPVLETRYPTTHPTLLRALEIMRANLFKPVSIVYLASVLGVSQRQLERICERDLGAGPAYIYRAMRLEAARAEVRASGRAMQDVARDHGFAAGSFAKTYTKHFGVTPTADRREAMAGLK